MLFKLFYKAVDAAFPKCSLYLVTKKAAEEVITAGDEPQLLHHKRDNLGGAMPKGHGRLAVS